MRQVSSLRQVTDTALLTTTEAASRLGISARTAVRWVASGRLKPALKLPGGTGAFLFTEGAVEEARPTS